MINTFCLFARYAITITLDDHITFDGFASTTITTFDPEKPVLVGNKLKEKRRIVTIPPSKMMWSLADNAKYKADSDSLLLLICLRSSYFGFLISFYLGAL